MQTELQLTPEDNRCTDTSGGHLNYLSNGTILYTGVLFPKIGWVKIGGITHAFKRFPEMQENLSTIKEGSGESVRRFKGPLHRQPAIPYSVHPIYKCNKW